MSIDLIVVAIFVLAAFVSIATEQWVKVFVFSFASVVVFINQYDGTAVFVELFPDEKPAGKKLESLGLVVLNEGLAFSQAKLTDDGIVFVNEAL